MSDRLKELQRQRALVEEQLVFLDREIAALHALAIPAPALLVKSSATPALNTAANVSDAASAERAAEEIMAHYKQQSQTLQSGVKRGCFIYFFAALALLSLGVFAIYFFKSRM